jgi:thioredoxin reductase (NADPH)
MQSTTFNVVIIGAGPAGLTAGIYSMRAGLKAIIVERAMVGGLAATAHLIENYPGFPGGIAGVDLTTKMKEQAERFGVHIVQAEVSAIEQQDRQFSVHTAADTYGTPAVILASGTIPKKIGVPGENTLRGRGVSYCATCDGPLFRDKKVAVVGCGNSGLQEGMFLLQFVKSITFIEFLPSMTGDKILQDRLLHEPRATFLLNHEVMSINGEQRVASIGVKNRATGDETSIDVDGIFIYIGLTPITDYVKDLVDRDENGFVKANENMATSTPGIFACGDIRSKKIRQVVNACAEGAIAALNAYHYIEFLKDTN